MNIVNTEKQKEIDEANMKNQNLQNDLKLAEEKAEQQRQADEQEKLRMQKDL